MHNDWHATQLQHSVPGAIKSGVCLSKGDAITCDFSNFAEDASSGTSGDNFRGLLHAAIAGSFQIGDLIALNGIRDRHAIVNSAVVVIVVYVITQMQVTPQHSKPCIIFRLLDGNKSKAWIQ
jgi:hypothetical protein